MKLSMPCCAILLLAVLSANGYSSGTTSAHASQAWFMSRGFRCAPWLGDQVVPASLLGIEPSLELGQVAREFLHRPPYYRLGSPESSKYPT
jgi:hypothetical protein